MGKRLVLPWCVQNDKTIPSVGNSKQGYYRLWLMCGWVRAHRVFSYLFCLDNRQMAVKRVLSRPLPPASWSRSSQPPVLPPSHGLCVAPSLPVSAHARPLPLGPATRQAPATRARQRVPREWVRQTA